MEKTLRGFTVIEVMVAAAVSAIVIFGAFALLQVSNKQLDIIHTKMSLQESSREALFKMAQEIRQTSAGRIQDFGSESKVQGDTINFHVPIPEPDASTLVDLSYNPLWAANIQYFLDADTRQIIRISRNLDTNETMRSILANDVTELEFSRPAEDSPLVMIEISVQKRLSDDRWIPSQPIHLSTQAEARNPS